jgi:hypothetical protein
MQSHFFKLLFHYHLAADTNHIFNIQLQKTGVDDSGIIDAGSKPTSNVSNKYRVPPVNVELVALP